MGITSHTSKRLALKLMAGLVSRKYESSLCKIAAHNSFTPQCLNLSNPEASQLKKLISEVVTQYTDDFPPAGPQPTSHNVGSIADGGRLLEPHKRVELQLDEAELTAECYQKELEKFEASVAAHKKRLLDNYIGVNAAIIVDDGTDLERRKRKLVALPVASEKKRKLFVKDFMVSQGVFVSVLLLFCFCIVVLVVVFYYFRYESRDADEESQVHV